MSAPKGGIKLRRTAKKKGHYAANYTRVTRNKTRQLRRWFDSLSEPTAACRADFTRCMDQIAGREYGKRG